MATQGERRRQAVAAIRALRRSYRAADTAGEKLERELDRLVKRKRLIQNESLATTGRLLDEYAINVQNILNVYIDTVQIIINIPV